MRVLAAFRDAVPGMQRAVERAAGAFAAFTEAANRPISKGNRR